MAQQEVDALREKVLAGSASEQEAAGYYAECEARNVAAILAAHAAAQEQVPD